ncbi:MAG: CheY-like chemotaxis protein [Enterobacterales bacterium]|jgi:CheY-like chemotaxis protein
MKKNALIVDDSRLACKIMANMLETLNIDSVSVYSAEEALVYLKHTLPDILFLDHSMPGLSGLEMIKLLKNNPHTATVPVMMYTAKEGEVYVGQARALGAVDVLPKGMEKDHLVKALTRLGFISLDNEAVVNDNQNPKKYIDRRKILQSEANHAVNKDAPDWKVFWQSQVEPFLNQQKRMQADEIRYSAGQQTVKITREIYKTLEQFEHALIARLSAHDEYKSIKHNLEQKFHRKFLYTSVILGLILIAAIFWQLDKNNETVQKSIALQNMQQQWNAKFEQMLENVNLKQLTEQTSELEPISIEPSAETTKQIVSLIDDYGTVVANNLILNSTNKTEYIGTTTSGYSITVNINGEVGRPIEERYFQNDDCNGHAYVNSESGVIYRDNKNLVWYVDTLAPVVTMKASSSINQFDVCVAAGGELLSLRLLEIDFNMVTGIDDFQEMSLYFRE